MIIVNLFGTPGSGKSTGAAYIFSMLKMKGVNCELITEFAKDKVYEESKEVFNNQIYIFAKQSFRISRVSEKVDVIITDSPLALSSFYNSDNRIEPEFSSLVFKVSGLYNSMNYFIKRVKPYNPLGRFQTEEESNNMIGGMKKLLGDNGVEYKIIDGNKDGYDIIVKEIMEEIKSD